MSYAKLAEYFEAGCLCILSGGLPLMPNQPAEVRAEQYMRSCVCSRHPDTARGITAPLHRKVLMLAKAEERNKEEWKFRQGRHETGELKVRMSIAERLRKEVVACAQDIANNEHGGVM